MLIHPHASRDSTVTSVQSKLERKTCLRKQLRKPGPPKSRRSEKLSENNVDALDIGDESGNVYVAVI